MRFPGLGQEASANEIIIGFSEAFLAIIVLAVVTKMHIDTYGRSVRRKGLAEALKKVKKIIWAGILAAATTSFLDVIRRSVPMNEKRRDLYIPVKTLDSDDYIEGIGNLEVSVIAASTVIAIIIGVMVFKYDADFDRTWCGSVDHYCW